VRGRLTALSLLAWIILPAAGAFAATPHRTAALSGIGIRLVDVPVDSRNDPRARSYIIDRLVPGSSSRRRVEIVNSMHTTAYVAVYPAAAFLRRGRFGFASGRTGNELSGWTTVTRDVLRLAPGAKALETVTINVPQQASSGTQYAVVWAAVSAGGPSTGGVTLVNRVGVRMYVSIGPGGTGPPNFVVGPLVAKRSATGKPFVVATAHNTGGRPLDIGGTLTLTDGPGGLRAGPFPVEVGTAVAPGGSAPVTVALDKRLPRGPWRAEMRLASGLIHRLAVTTITFPRAAKPATVKIAPGGSGHLILVLGLLLVSLAVVTSWHLLSRRSSPGALQG
jgi:hypothetical protein